VRAPIFDSCGSLMAVGDTTREMTEEVCVVVFNRCGSMMSVAHIKVGRMTGKC
jgi:hypothetical protein